MNQSKNMITLLNNRLQEQPQFTATIKGTSNIYINGAPTVISTNSEMRYDYAGRYYYMAFESFSPYLTYKKTDIYSNNMLTTYESNNINGLTPTSSSGSAPFPQPCFDMLFAPTNCNTLYYNSLVPVNNIVNNNTTAYTLSNDAISSIPGYTGSNITISQSGNNCFIITASIKIMGSNSVEEVTSFTMTINFDS